jgi:hypothetical protein
MFISNTASLVQLHLLEGLSMIRVNEFHDLFGDFESTRLHLLAYPGVKETDNPNILSLNDCYSESEGVEIDSWQVVA